MINKLDLTSVISKYYLNGMVEAVKWDIKDENMTIKFNAPTKDMIGRVEFKGMPLEDSTIGVILSNLLTLFSKKSWFPGIIITGPMFSCNCVRNQDVSIICSFEILIF